MALIKMNNSMNNQEDETMNTEDIHMREVLTYFEGLDEPPSDFFKFHTWILYIHLGICVHGFIMNTFLVQFIFLRIIYYISL